LKNRNLLAALLLVVSLVVLLPASSEAGKPIYKDAGEETTLAKAKVIPDSTGAGVAYSYYADLGAGKVDIYQIYAKAGQQPKLSLAAPRFDDLKGFTPSLALVGPGISSTASLPINVPQGMGVVTLDYTGDPNARGTGSDQASGKPIWLGQSYNTAYPQENPYYLIVWDKQGRAGKYILSLGENEENGLFDILKFPYTWVKLQLWFGNWLAVGIALLVVIVVVTLIAALLRRRKPAAPTAS